MTPMKPIRGHIIRCEESDDWLIAEDFVPEGSGSEAYVVWAMKNRMEKCGVPVGEMVWTARPVTMEDVPLPL